MNRNAKHFLIGCLLIFGAIVIGCSPSNVESPLVQTVNNIDIEFYGFERSGAYLKTNICYEQPGEAWYPNNNRTFLFVDGQEILPSNQQFQPTNEHRGDFACGNIEFPVGVTSDLGEVELVIEQLTTSVTEYDCEKAQRKLDEANTGIVVSCEFSTLFGSNASSFFVTTKPENFSQEEALEIARDAFAITAEGPWRFVFTIFVGEGLEGEFETQSVVPAATSGVGVVIELGEIKREDAHLLVSVCYVLPNDEIWKPDHSVLIMGNQEVPSTSTSLNRVNDRDDGFFCSEITFPVGVSADLGELELVVGQLETEVVKYDCVKAQKKLDEMNLDVILDCSLGDFYSFSTPQNLTDEEMLELIKVVEDAFADIIQGPWRFDFIVE